MILLNRRNNQRRGHRLAATVRYSRHNTRNRFNLTRTSITTRRPIRQFQHRRITTRNISNNLLIQNFLRQRPNTRHHMVNFQINRHVAFTNHTTYVGIRRFNNGITRLFNNFTFNFLPHLKTRPIRQHRNVITTNMAHSRVRINRKRMGFNTLNMLRRRRLNNLVISFRHNRTRMATSAIISIRR